MKLYTPSTIEVRILLGSPSEFNGTKVRDGSLPPAFLLEAAIAASEDKWMMPRLFYDEHVGEIVGSGGYKSAPIGRKIEIGYGIAPDCRGRGFATAGVRLLVAEAFATGCVDEIVAETTEDNVASQKVLSHAGFGHYGKANSDEGPLILWNLRRSAIGTAGNIGDTFDRELR
jgi:ribosomal-protein-alanine N-acetyltransferase